MANKCILIRSGIRGATGADGTTIEYGTVNAPDDPGVTGSIQWDESYLYVCIATNTWRRTLLDTWDF